ncbi:MAG: hypothetical protein CML29_07070 [Rhizobiales bacterium]|mgnify:CR=1 FL=1|nr:hypothetical protein [Hyphomicrobiales bacterium]
MLNGKLIYLAYLALAGLVGVGGFIVVPKLLNKNPPAVVSEQAPEENSGKSDRVAKEPASPAEEASQEVEVAKADPAEAAPLAMAEPMVPAFDLVRVEPDGSLVVAGTGEPNGKIEVLSGENTITGTDVGPSGDFVAVLDEPLAPGDYQLQLLSTAPDGTKTYSEEIATVSVPDGSSGDLLAMVAKPGEASRILTQPEPEEKPEAREMASADPAPVVSDTPSDDSPEATAGEPENRLPDLPAASRDLSGSAPSVVADEQPDAATQDGTGADTGTAEEDTSTPASEPAQTETAALASDTDEPVTGNTPAAELMIRVDAVEIEGDTIYVAGAATAGMGVRVLADDEEIGLTKSDDGGRFIVEAPVDLTVGEHQIAAELLTAGGADVAMRAVVPFTRPEGNRMAAVAAPDDGSTTSEPAVDGSNTVEQDRLTPASGSVIIRKGDTLWEISRRTYGQGVRYTTIYLANQQQIVDPNLISPGQVFSVPEKWDQDAEKTHHDLLERRKHPAN